MTVLTESIYMLEIFEFKRLNIIEYLTNKGELS